MQAHAAGEILWLERPDPERLARLPRGAVVICERGSPLCHGALIARARGLNAIFGVNLPPGLVEGMGIQISPDGTVAPEAQSQGRDN